MSLTDDLALVTACRAQLHTPPVCDTDRCIIGGAALSLIEDTLDRHALVENTSRRYGYGATYCEGCLSAEHPCDDYRDHLAALHAIATALGVEVLA